MMLASGLLATLGLLMLVLAVATKLFGFQAFGQISNLLLLAVALLLLALYLLVWEITMRLIAKVEE